MKVYGEDRKSGEGYSTCDLFSGVYIHGELEEINGYDLVDAPRYVQKYFIDKGDTIEDIEVVLNDGKHYDCIIYYWKDNNESNRGLICLKEDKTYNKDAYRKYTNKQTHI